MLDVRGNHETKMCVDNYGGRLGYQQENRQLPLEATELQGVKRAPSSLCGNWFMEM